MLNPLDLWICHKCSHSNLERLGENDDPFLFLAHEEISRTLKSKDLDNTSRGSAMSWHTHAFRSPFHQRVKNSSTDQVWLTAKMLLINPSLALYFQKANLYQFDQNKFFFFFFRFNFFAN